MLSTRTVPRNCGARIRRSCLVNPGRMSRYCKPHTSNFSRPDLKICLYLPKVNFSKSAPKDHYGARYPNGCRARSEQPVALLGLVAGFAERPIPKLLRVTAEKIEKIETSVGTPVQAARVQAA